MSSRNFVSAYPGDPNAAPTGQSAPQSSQVTAHANTLRHRADASQASPPRAGSIHRRRAATSTSAPRSHLPHLGINPGPIQQFWPQDDSHSHKTWLHAPLTPTRPPAVPIDIPQRKNPSGSQAIPLSGRPTNLKTLEAFAKAHKPKYSSSPGSQASSDKSDSPTKSCPPEVSSMDPRHVRQTSLDHFSSPLSPSRPVPIPLSERSRKPRRPQQSLNLAGLPKFHPANFPNADSAAPVSPRNRNITSAARHNRPGSDAQQRLQQYQRGVVASFSRLVKSPSSPRLVPQSSPGEAMTPLQLEGSGDYLTAGSGATHSNATNAREHVGMLVQRENERRNYPEARSGSLSPAISPSVSPAVSPAGGPG